MNYEQAQLTKEMFSGSKLLQMMFEEDVRWVQEAVVP